MQVYLTITYVLGFFILYTLYQEEGQLTIKDVLLLALSPLSMFITVVMKVASHVVNLDEVILMIRREE